MISPFILDISKNVDIVKCHHFEYMDDMCIQKNTILYDRDSLKNCVNFRDIRDFENFFFENLPSISVDVSKWKHDFGIKNKIVEALATGRRIVQNGHLTHCVYLMNDEDFNNYDVIGNTAFIRRKDIQIGRWTKVAAAAYSELFVSSEFPKNTIVVAIKPSKHEGETLLYKKEIYNAMATCYFSEEDKAFEGNYWFPNNGSISSSPISLIHF